MAKKETTVVSDAEDAELVVDALLKAQGAAEEKSVTDIVGGGAFYPDLPKMSLLDIKEVTHRLLDASILVDVEGDYGTHDLALFLVEDLLTGEQYTTACSGMVVLKKTRKLIELKSWPILCTFVKPGKYWDMI